MRYLIVGNAALLSSRNIEKVSDRISLEALGVSPSMLGVTVILLKEGKAQRSYMLADGKADIPLCDLYGEGNYSVVFAWQEKNADTDEVTDHAAYGNAFRILSIEGCDEMGIAPAYYHTVKDVDTMWGALVQMMELILPFIEQYKYGNDVI